MPWGGQKKVYLGVHKRGHEAVLQRSEQTEARESSSLESILRILDFIIKKEILSEEGITEKL